MVAISRHQEINRGGLHRGAEMERDGGLAAHGPQQNLHQGPVLKDPAHCCAGVGRAGEIVRSEGNLAMERAVAEIEATEGRKGGQEFSPEAELLEQRPAGVGEGVGAAAGAELLGAERVNQLHPPACSGHD